MGRIRTIKPDFFKHEGLYEAEVETGLPLRLAFIGLWTASDREGRFNWRPRALKTDVLPYDEVDFSRVLDALATRGFIVKYRVGMADFGSIPSFPRHQVVNHRESASILPPPPETIEEIDPSATREPRVQGTPGGKGKEGKGKEGKDSSHADASLPSIASSTTTPQPAVPLSGEASSWTGSAEERFWVLAATAEAKGIARSQLGQLANQLGGDFDRALGIVVDAMAARGPRAYLARIITNIRSETAGPVAVVDPDTPTWVTEARSQGYPVELEDGRWRMAGALYDDAGEQVGN